MRWILLLLWNWNWLVCRLMCMIFGCAFAIMRCGFCGSFRISWRFGLKLQKIGLNLWQLSHNDSSTISIPKKINFFKALISNWKPFTSYICYTVTNHKFSLPPSFVHFMTSSIILFVSSQSHIHVLLCCDKKIIYRRPWMLFQEHISRKFIL